VTLRAQLRNGLANAANTMSRYHIQDDTMSRYHIQDAIARINDILDPK